MMIVLLPGNESTLQLLSVYVALARTLYVVNGNTSVRVNMNGTGCVTLEVLSGRLVTFTPSSSEVIA